jgi:hypothetical protein
MAHRMANDQQQLSDFDVWLAKLAKMLSEWAERSE